MNIAIITSGYYPFSDTAQTGIDAACLADELLSLGHEVSAVALFSKSVDLRSHSLARRLVPIPVEIDGIAAKVVRYDGRTSTGINVHLLDVNGSDKHSIPKQRPQFEINAFCAASVLLFKGMQKRADVYIVWDEAFPAVSMIKADGAEPSKPKVVLAITRASLVCDDLTKSIAKADRMFIIDPCVEQALRSAGQNNLAEMFDHGFATALKRPVRCTMNAAASDKLCAKTAFQIKQSLPVREDVPLVCFPIRSSHYSNALEALLRRNVQVIALQEKENEETSALALRYEDRLTLVSQQDIENTAIFASDACFVGNDPAWTNISLLAQTLPIAEPLAAAGLVEIEPNCQSGNAVIIKEVSDLYLNDAISRLETAFLAGRDFYKMLERLVNCTSTWGTAARQILQLMDNI